MHIGVRVFCCFLMVVILLACGGCRATYTPAPATEWRGVWVSFLDLRELLANTTPTSAAAALDKVMDICVEHRLNTILFHVRSHSDAWYASSLFPASAVAAPLLAAGFDPLAYAVQAAHRRGLAIHAWINPYRIGPDPANAVTDAHFQKDGIWYYDPTDSRARQVILTGVREILEGYAVDGIHFDDYFYPTNMAAEGEDFENIPADTEPALWRQTHVNALISAVYGLVHTYPEKVFGISPAGTPTACADGYADIATWMTTAGYIDYICPQIYFGFQHETKAFDTLLTRWATMPRRQEVALYIGLALYKVGIRDDTYAGSGRGEWAQHYDIIARQVIALREKTMVGGFALFRYAHLTEDTAALRQERQALAACI